MCLLRGPGGRYIRRKAQECFERLLRNDKAPRRNADGRQFTGGEKFVRCIASDA